MFYEILNLRAPNVSNFAEALKVADPSTFKDSWKLADGFVAAEGMFKIEVSRSPLGVVHKLCLQDEVGRWLSKCQQMSTGVGRWSVLCQRCLFSIFSTWKVIE